MHNSVCQNPNQFWHLKCNNIETSKMIFCEVQKMIKKVLQIFEHVRTQLIIFYWSCLKVVLLFRSGGENSIVEDLWVGSIIGFIHRSKRYTKQNLNSLVTHITSTASWHCFNNWMFTSVGILFGLQLVWINLLLMYLETMVS